MNYIRNTLKILGLLALTLFISLAALFVIGKILTNHIETEPDAHALESWGPGTSFLALPSGETHILDIGDGDVILLIHGSTGSIADWQEKVAEPLAKTNRVVAFDSYGFGLSERNASFDYGHPLWTQQAVEVLDALEIERAVVVGHSAGAVVAIALADYYPERVRGVILSGHGLALDPLQMVPMLPGIGELWAARQTLIGDSFSDSYGERAEEVHHIRGTRAAYLAFLRSQTRINATSLQFLRSAYEDIKAPVLQLHGVQDEAIPIEAARDLSPRIADTRLAAIDGSGHFIHIDAPDQWIGEVTAFVEGLGP